MGIVKKLGCRAVVAIVLTSGIFFGTNTRSAHAATVCPKANCGSTCANQPCQSDAECTREMGDVGRKYTTGPDCANCNGTGHPDPYTAGVYVCDGHLAMLSVERYSCLEDCNYSTGGWEEQWHCTITIPVSTSETPCTSGWVAP